MGQIVTGVLYGVAAPKGVALWDDDASDGGLLERWDTATGEWRAKYRMGYASPDYPPLVFGYWVLCREHGIPHTSPANVAVESLKRGKPYARAQAAWKKFAAWAKKEGVALPKATLWIVLTEVA